MGIQQMVLREYRDRESLGSNRIYAFDIIRIGKSDILIENEILSLTAYHVMQ